METQHQHTEIQPVPLDNPGAWPEQLPAPTLGDRARELGGVARDRARQTAGWLNEAWKATGDKIGEYREGGFERVKEDTLRYTRTQPGAALGIAAGVGVVIGLLSAITQSRYRPRGVAGNPPSPSSRDLSRDIRHATSE